jgi:hypothetical protein
MVRPRIELDEFRDEIERRIGLRHTQSQIRTWLLSRGCRVSRNTLSTRVNAWEASRQSRTADSDPTLLAAIEREYHNTHHDDSAIAEALITQGIHTTQRQVKRVRLANNWLHREHGDGVAEKRAQTFALVRQALEEGTVRCYGRGLLQSYLRLKGHHAREDDVRDALAHLDPEGTEARRRGPDKTRQSGEFITPGPDFLWCCDGHDKFRNYGIEIYAGVDAYSRRIQWVYVGNSNRRQISVLRQALAVIEDRDRCPSYWRSDRGKEVLLLADSQFSFYRKHKEALGATPEEIESLRFRDCYMFGTSTANVKIESTWMRMLLSQTRPWLVSYPVLPVPLTNIFLCQGLFQVSNDTWFL